jgi:hypothetical protein
VMWWWSAGRLAVWAVRELTAALFVGAVPSTTNMVGGLSRLRRGLSRPVVSVCAGKIG